ncbi:MAG: BspA family leucine-rich repeat surface protein, partial [Lachnospiraceae bacterium]|nr:BspA family leucine-rich repeat surface protein [Lachnospiraceae bacterium]
MKRKTTLRILAATLASVLTMGSVIEPLAAYTPEKTPAAEEVSENLSTGDAASEEISAQTAPMGDPVVTPLAYWDYELRELDDTIIPTEPVTNTYCVLKRYIGPAEGSVSEITIPGDFTIDGVKYLTLLEGLGGVERKDGKADGTSPVDALTSISADGVALGGPGIFSYCYNVETIDIAQTQPQKTVTDLSGMFKDCRKLKDLKFCVECSMENVTNLSEMFMNCSSLEILKLQMAGEAVGATDLRRMFAGCENLRRIYASGTGGHGDGYVEIYKKATEKINGEDPGAQMFLGCSSLSGEYGTKCDGKGREGIAYAVVDSIDAPGLFSSLYDNIIVTDTSYFHTSLNEEDHTVTLDAFYPGKFSDLASETYFFYIPSVMEVEGEEYRVILKRIMDPDEADSKKLVKPKVRGVILGKGLKIAEDATGLFMGCTTLEDVDLSYADFSQTKVMESLFEECVTLHSIDFEGVDTSSAVNMKRMFYGCTNLYHIDHMNFDTRSVEYMNGMFGFCNYLYSVDLSSFETPILKEVTAMFYACGNLTTVYARDGFAYHGEPDDDLVIFTEDGPLTGGEGSVRKEGGLKDYQLFGIDRKESDGKPGLFTKKLLIGDYSYPFINSYSGMQYSQGYHIPAARFKSVFGDKGDFMHYFYDEEWNGSCYGLSASSGMFYNDKNGFNISDYDKTAKDPASAHLAGAGDPDESGDALKKFIEEMHLSQYDVRVQLAYLLNSDVQTAFDTVMHEKNPVILGLFGPEGGHAVLAYEAGFEGDYAYIKVYDSNWPGEERKVLLHNVGDGEVSDWYYDLGSEEIQGPHWGTMGDVSEEDMQECELAFIPYDLYSAVYMDKGLYQDADWIIPDEDETVWTAEDEEAYFNWVWTVMDQELYEKDPWTDEEEALYQSLGGDDGGAVSEDEYNEKPWSDTEEA